MSIRMPLLVTLVLLSSVAAVPAGAGASPLPRARVALDLLGDLLVAEEHDPMGLEAARLAARSALGASSVETDRRLDLAGRVLERASDPLAQAWLILGPPATLPRSSSPSEAARALARRLGTPLSGADRGELSRLDTLPAPARPVLARLLAAQLVLSRMAVRDPGDGASVDPLRRVVLDAAVELADLLPGGTGEADPIQVPPVISVDHEGLDWTYTEDFAVLIDAGGADTYRNNAGGSNLSGGSCMLGSNGAAMLLDAGGASDDYASGRNCGANGGGSSGIGFLLDMGGNDRYVAGSGGVNGGANGGSGFLLDMDGSDTYEGMLAGTNGGGSNEGSGLLIDGGGGDSYRAEASGANGGANSAGAGMLVDDGGDDTYMVTGGFGANGGANGASGMLLDGGGRDIYDGNGFGSNGGGNNAGSGLLVDRGQSPDAYLGAEFSVNGGGGSNGGAGMLVDGGGDDSYRAGGFASNGGASGGRGTLVDLGGDDDYIGGRFGSNGGANTGVGLLADLGGDDVYSAEDFATNGGAGLGGTGRLIDADGDDDYIGGRTTSNGAASSGSGLLLDAGGTDRFQDPGIPGGAARNCSLAPRGSGALVDLPGTGCLERIPTAPVLDASTPSSPANANRPFVLGTAPPGATVYVFAQAGPRCDQPAAGTTVAGESGAVSVPVDLADDTTTILRAVAVDASGNASVCSRTTFTYVEDSTPPGMTIDEIALGDVVTIRGTGGTAPFDEPVIRMEVFREGGADPLATYHLEPEGGAWSVEIAGETFPGSGSYRVFARQSDAAGNTHVVEEVFSFSA